MHFIHVKASVYWSLQTTVFLFPSWTLQYPKVTLVSSLSSGGILPVCALLCKPFHLFLCLFSAECHGHCRAALQMGTGWSAHSACFGVWAFTGLLLLSLPNASIVSTFPTIYLGVHWSFPWFPLMTIQLPAVGVAASIDSLTKSYLQRWTAPLGTIPLLMVFPSHVGLCNSHESNYCLIF